MGLFRRSKMTKMERVEYDLIHLYGYKKEKLDRLSDKQKLDLLEEEELFEIEEIEDDF